MRVMDDNVIDVTPENARPGGEAARERDDSLKSWSWVSYALHLIVALSAVVPGAQGGVTLLLIWRKRKTRRAAGRKATSSGASAR